eukprot:scaffold1336_cov379-Prasinococcus_capsulatus_cf.AAC.8
MKGGMLDPLAGISDDDDEEEDDDGEQEEEEPRQQQQGGAELEPPPEQDDEGGAGAKKTGATKEVDFEALQKAGYGGGPSVLLMPHAKQQHGDPNWSWGKGDRARGRDGPETEEERESTRAAIQSTEAGAKAALQVRLLERSVLRPGVLSLIAVGALAQRFEAEKKRKQAVIEESKARSFKEREKVTAALPPGDRRVTLSLDGGA